MAGDRETGRIRGIVTCGLHNRRAAFVGMVAWALLIAVAMLIPPASMSSPPGGDKLHHLVAFAVLGCLAVLAGPRRPPMVIAFALIYGAALEVLQPLTGRHAELGDAVADASGAALGAMAALLMLRAVGPVRPGTCRRATSQRRSPR